MFREYVSFALINRVNITSQNPILINTFTKVYYSIIYIYYIYYYYCRILHIRKLLKFQIYFMLVEEKNR